MNIKTKKDLELLSHISLLLVEVWKTKNMQAYQQE